MKRRMITLRLARVCALTVLLMCITAPALAYDGAAAQQWMEQFAQALGAFAPMNDAEQTSDPARAGQYLIEYEFGTVLASVPKTPLAQEILEIDVRTSQVTDCRGVRVGMELATALDGETIAAADSTLVVLHTQEEKQSWSWAYVGPDGVYGVEYIAYADSGSGMTEYTLTYVIESGVITAIRMKAAEATAAQAQDGLKTAQEIMDKGVWIAMKNDQPVFAQSDLQVQGGAALGVPVADLIAHMGEPQEVQTLPNTQGRMLLYDGAAVRLAFHEETGEERVRGVSVNSAAIEGPRRLTVGMPVQTAAGLFACETDVTARGGTLYLEGEAEGEAPYGKAIASGTELLLRYACVTDDGETALLEAGIADGKVAYWSLSYAGDTQGGM